MPANTTTIPDFPYSMTISLPLPTNRLASAALRTIEVDTELSPFVRRTMTLTTPNTPSEQAKQAKEEDKTVLETVYRATTNRMLRVSVNGFMESLHVILGVTQELDVDVLRLEGGEK